MSLASQLVALATRIGEEIAATRDNGQIIVRWNGSSWPARPTGAPFGVLFLSTNDPDATPPGLPLTTGDVWRRHRDAV